MADAIPEFLRELGVAGRVDAFARGDIELGRSRQLRPQLGAPKPAGPRRR